MLQEKQKSHILHTYLQRIQVTDTRQLNWNRTLDVVGRKITEEGQIGKRANSNINAMRKNI